MNVSADPRVIKQLLLSQWINHANPLEPSARTEDGSVFGMMLDELLESSLPENPPPSLAGRLQADLRADSLPVSGPFDGETGMSSAYDGLIAAAAAKYGLDPALIKGVIQVESAFDANAESHAGAKGLMQLMDETARGLGVRDVWDPAQNIDGGSRFLSYLLRKYNGNVSSALAAYNAGPGRVDRLGLVNDELIRQRMDELPEETQHYIDKVLTAARQWAL